MFSGCSADLKTKDIAKEKLQDASVAVIENYFNFSYVENHAIAFGFLGGIDKSIRMPLIFTLTISVTFLLFFAIWRMRRLKLRLLLPFFVILSGAYGNIIDRMMHGFVTDFFHAHYFGIHSFPVFNLADVLVNIGIVLMVLQWKELQLAFDNLFSRKEIKA